MNEIEKAIEILGKTPCNLTHGETQAGVADAFDLAVDALQEKADRENPMLLTLDDLRDMVGEPVFNEYENIWQIISDIDEVDELCTIINMTDGDEYDTEDGFPGFYRTKPTGGE